MTHVQPQTPPRATVRWRSTGLFAVRYGIGAVMVLAGIVMLAIDGGELGWYGLASAIGADRENSSTRCPHRRLSDDD
jgi:hypothetical protein